jgi:asparagine synthase (glutamine-hydrolysing)
VYWAKLDGLFMFASELKALREYPGWTPRIKPEAVASSMRHNYIPAPHTIYQNVYKLEPGTILTFATGNEPHLQKFWDARNVAREGLQNPLYLDDSALTDRLEALLIDAVGKRMMADVPLGAFLSGGVDSSVVVALMKAANSGPVKTFSIGFERAEYNEAPHAAAIAQASRHRAHRTDGLVARGTRCCAATGGHVRRTVCRFVADSGLSGVRDDAQARHGRVVGG